MPRDTTLQICKTGFIGNFEDGRMRAFIAGRDILDPSKPEEAALLKLWGKFFTPVASTHVYPEKPPAPPKAPKSRAKKAAAAPPTPEPEPAPEPPAEPDKPFGLTNTGVAANKEAADASADS